MIELTLNEIHSILLKMMLDVDGFCRENGIRYSLGGGTMLGAVRHKGFIPWDDDVDLFMPRPDFTRFVALYNDARKDSPYKCSYGNNLPEYPRHTAWAKVMDERTCIIERNGEADDFGINLDIFPVEGTPEDPQERERFARRSSSLCHRLLLSGRPLFPLSTHVPVFAHLSALRHSPQWWFDTVESFISQYDFEKSEYVWAVCERYDLEYPVERETFNHLEMMDFEGYKLPVFDKWDEYMTKLYGDYMTPLPENKRVCHYAKTFWKKGSLPTWLKVDD